LRTRRGDPSARHQISSAHLAPVERDVEGQFLHGAETARERSLQLVSLAEVGLPTLTNA